MGHKTFVASQETTPHDYNYCICKDNNSVWNYKKIEIYFDLNLGIYRHKTKCCDSKIELYLYAVSVNANRMYK